MIFDMKNQLLVSDENKILESFFKGFKSAEPVANIRTRVTKQFKFLVIGDDEKCIEGSDFLYRKLIEPTELIVLLQNKEVTF